MTADIGAGIARYLTVDLGRTITVARLQQLSAGARRRNFVLDADLGDRSLRLVATLVPSTIQLVPIEIEAAVRELAREHGVPVPRVVATCTDTSYVGEPFLLSEHIDGESVPRKVLRLTQAQGIGDLVAEQLGRAMGLLHAIDPASAPSELPGTPDGNPAERLLCEAEREVDRLLADRPVFALALRRLRERLPGPPEKHTIVHTDLRNGNLIVGPDGLRAVLDWEGAQRFDDPMRDAAWTALRMWRFGADAHEFGGFAERAVFVRGYEDGGGSFDPDRFRWWKLLSTLCWGTGLAGQAAAHLDGSVRNVVMAASGRRISEIEWDLLMLIRPGTGL